MKAVLLVLALVCNLIPLIVLVLCLLEELSLMPAPGRARGVIRYNGEKYKFDYDPSKEIISVLPDSNGNLGEETTAADDYKWKTE